MKAYNLQTALQNPENITELFIHNRNLKEIPEAVFELKNLRVLGLSQNRIAKISDRVEVFRFLEKLDLSINDLESFPIALLKIQSLKSLNINNNRIAFIPEAINELKQLEDFNAVKNGLEVIPRSLFSPLLKKLNLSENKITKIPGTIKNALHLERLFLQKNSITRLPENITDCRRLQVINLCDNKIKTLPDNFGDLVRLEKILLSKNKLKTLPRSIGQCTFLRELDLSRNRIDSLPDAIGQLNWLIQLDLSRNKLQILPRSTGKLSKLRMLNLEYNQLTQLPDTYEQLKVLNHLLLKGNAIETNKMTLLKLEKLQKLTGLSLQFSSKDRRQFLSFLKCCRQQKIEEKERQCLYQLLTTDQKSTKPILIKALSLPIKEIRQKALNQFLKNYNPELPLSSGSLLVFCGRSNLDRARIILQLQSIGIECQRQINSKVTHVVLGEYADVLQLSSLNRKVSFLSEQKLQAIVIKKTESNQKQFSDVEIQNLQRLLLNGEEQNTSIAIQILKNTIVPHTIITELFIAFKSAASRQHKRQIRALLDLNGSPMLRKKLSLRLRLSKDLEKDVLLKNIDRYVEGTELIKEKIITFFA